MSRKIKFLSRKAKKVLDKLSLLWYNKSTAKERSSKRKKKAVKQQCRKEHTMRRFELGSLTILVKESDSPNDILVQFLADNKYPSNWEHWGKSALEWEYDIKL